MAWRMTSLDPQEPFAMTIGTMGLSGDEGGRVLRLLSRRRWWSPTEDARIAICRNNLRGLLLLHP